MRFVMAKGLGHNKTHLLEAKLASTDTVCGQFGLQKMCFVMAKALGHNKTHVR